MDEDEVLEARAPPRGDGPEAAVPPLPRATDGEDEPVLDEAGVALDTAVTVAALALRATLAK